MNIKRGKTVTTFGKLEPGDVFSWAEGPVQDKIYMKCETNAHGPNGPTLVHLQDGRLGYESDETQVVVHKHTLVLEN